MRVGMLVFLVGTPVVFVGMVLLSGLEIALKISLVPTAMWFLLFSAGQYHKEDKRAFISSDVGKIPLMILAFYSYFIAVSWIVTSLP